MNNRAQIGKLISIFPMLFLIFIIMGIFVVLSAVFSIGKSSESPTFMEKIVVQDDLILKTINVGLYERNSQGDFVPAPIQEMSVLDAIVMYEGADPSEKERFKDLRIALRSLLTMDENCLFIYSDKAESPSQTDRFSPTFFIERMSLFGEFSHYEGDSKNVEAALTRYKNMINYAKPISFMKGSERIYVDYYFGRCE